MKARALVPVVLAFALGACGSDSRTDGPADTPVVSSSKSIDPTPGSTGRPVAPRGPRIVEPEGGLENVIPTAWLRAKPAPDGLSARFFWYSGVEECYGLDRVAIYPRDDMVVVTLFAGTRPEAETCIELAEKVVTVVHFKEPLGDREIVDGALPD